MSLPNEIWIAIFTHVEDVPTLKAILSTSRHFHVLGLEEALRNLVWNTAEKTHRRLAELLQSPDKRRLPRILSMKLEEGDPIENRTLFSWESPNLRLAKKPDLCEALRVRCIGTLSNLRSLTIVGGTILPHYFDAFRQLRRLETLRLHDCAVCTPHCGAAADPLGEPDLAITTLGLHDIVVCNQIERGTPHLWRRVHDFAIFSSTQTMAYVEGQAALFLPHLPNLHKLCVHGLPDDSDLQTWMSIDPPQLRNVSPLLRSLSGSWRMALEMLSSATELEEISVHDTITATQAVELVDGLNSETIRVVELELETWDESVLRRIVQTVPNCETLSIVYRSGCPTSDFLLRTFPDHLLPLLPRLSTLRLRRPADSLLLHSIFRRHYSSYDEYMASVRAWRDDLATGRVRLPPPSEAQCLEYVLQWGRTGRLLASVSLVPRKEWVRCGRRGKWVLRTEDLH
ncbi:hypothetical protein C8F01DRAFT_544700 [Mycena amicta]|nr:hypothetical protein C8F01DRAFT_544700 [Mycena amicta]